MKEPNEALAPEAPPGTPEANLSGPAKPEKSPLLREVRSLAVRLAVFAAVLWVLLTQVYLVTQASGSEMFPAVKDGDLVLGIRLDKDYAKNDVVVYERSGRLRVGRVLARGGDIVTLSESGVVEVNGSAQGGGIRSIRNAEGTEFVNRRPGGALWSMKLKKIHPDTKGLPPVVPLSIDPEQDDGTGGKNIDSHIDDLDFSALDAVKLGARPRMSVKDGQIHFFWEGIRIGGESGALDVWAKAEFSADGTFCMIDGGFTNRSTDYTVFYFALPQLDGLGALH